MKPIEINCPKQLLVEGNTPKFFFSKILADLGLANDCQIQNFGGVKDLSSFLKAFAKLPGFADEVESVGIVRDAEESFSAAFQSVCLSIEKAGLSPPETLASMPRANVFILPDNRSSGVLEDLCIQALQEDPANECVDRFLGCLDERVDTSLWNNAKRSKARMHAFLASRSRPELRLGEAAQAGVMPLESGVFNPLREFICNI